MSKTLSRRYIKEVKLLLPSVHRQERVYLNKMESMIEDYCQEQPGKDMSAIYQEFGTPQDTIADYYRTMDTEPLIRLFQIRRIKKNVFLTLSACVVTVTIFLLATLYQAHLSFMRSEPVFKETTIIIEEK